MTHDQAPGSSGRWVEVAPSEHAHEREGLEHVRAHLPSRAPWFAWSNVEFVAMDGTPHEVDLVVLGPAGSTSSSSRHGRARSSSTRPVASTTGWSTRPAGDGPCNGAAP